jgi:mono/diheme cytochrome c family protein
MDDSGCQQRSAERLTRLFGLGAVLLALSGCDARELPADYQSPPVPLQMLLSRDAQGAGQELFFLHCSQCHGENADGQGTIRRSLSTRPADFTDPKWREAVSPEWVFYVISQGRKHTAMAGWDLKLSNEECWSLAAFILSRAKTVNNAGDL